MPSPLIDTWPESTATTGINTKECGKTNMATRSNSTPVQKQLQQRPQRASAPKLSEHEAHALVECMSSDLMMSHALSSASVAARSQVPVLCDVTHDACKIFVVRYKRTLMCFYVPLCSTETASQCRCRSLACSQAHRAVLDITRANQDYATEQSMRIASDHWDAATAERSRALSLHVSEKGRHTFEGSARVAASEATLVFDQQESS